MSDYYDHTGFPSTGSAGLSASMRAEFDKIEAAFAKLPSLTGNDGKPLVVSGGGTSVGVTAGTLTLSGNFIKSGAHSLTFATTATTSLTLPTTGTLASLTGTETFTNKTLTAPTITAPSISGAWAIVTSTQGGHAIGTTASATAAMVWSLARTGGGSSAVYGLNSFAAITGGVSDAIAGHLFTTQLNKAASGTHATADNVLIGTTTHTGAATATDACALRIIGAPTAGTNNYSLKVDAGTTRLGGLLDLSPAAAGQIKFPATPNDSADVNTLDDYEEGTWTPSLGGTATYTSRTGTYTKIGRQVTVHCEMTVNSIGTGSATQVSGLPFTSGVNTYNGGCSFTAIQTSVVFVTAQIQSASNVVIFPALTAAGTGTTTPAIFKNGAAIVFSVTYHL